MRCIDLTESRLEVRRRRGVGELPLREEADRVRERESIARIGGARLIGLLEKYLSSCRCRGWKLS